MLHQKCKLKGGRLLASHFSFHLAHVLSFQNVRGEACTPVGYQRLERKVEGTC